MPSHRPTFVDIIKKKFAELLRDAFIKPMPPRWEKCVHKPGPESKFPWALPHEINSTYEIGRNDAGQEFIQFSPCGVTSYYDKDIEHRFCAYCDEFIPKGTDTRCQSKFS